MDKKVKYKKLAKKAFRQALKEENFSYMCISSQVERLTNNSDIEVYFNSKEKFKKLIKEDCPFFIEIEDKEDLPILLDLLKSLVIRKYNNLENEELKPTQALQLMLLMDSFSDMRWVRDNLKKRFKKLPMATYLVAKLFTIPGTMPEDFTEFVKELNKVF